MDVSSEHQQADSSEPRRTNRAGSRRGWLVVSLGLVLGGAFTVSATSTWLLGEHHQLDSLARSALILMLEVGSVTGASIYVITRRPGTRTRAGLVVAIATGVGATGGVQAYGFLIGLPVAALLLLLVDLIGKFWHESIDVDSAGETAEGEPEGWSARMRTWWRGEGQDISEPGSAVDVDGVPQQEADSADDQPLPEVRGVEPDVVARAAELLSRPRSSTGPGQSQPIGRPALARELGISDHRAGLVLAALRPLRAVEGEAS